MVERTVIDTTLNKILDRHHQGFQTR